MDQSKELDYAEKGENGPVVLNHMTVTDSSKIDDVVMDDIHETDLGTGKLHQRKPLVLTEERPVYNQIELDNIYDGKFRRPSRWTGANFAKACVYLCGCTGICARRTIKRVLPFIDIFRGYTGKDLVNDIIAGLTVGIMQIPQGKKLGVLLA